MTAEKESVDVESWDDGCIVPSCQRTCFKGENTKDVCIPKTDANSNQVSSAGSPPVCEEPRSGYGDIQGVLPLEKALTVSHLPGLSVESITRDSIGEEVVTKKKDVKDKEKALTDSHLPVPNVENITCDSVVEKVVTEKKDMKDKEIKNFEVNNL